MAYVAAIQALPTSREHIAAIQSERKRMAFERAKSALWCHHERWLRNSRTTKGETSHA